MDDPYNFVVPALQGVEGLHDIDEKQDSVHVRISRFELKFEFQSHFTFAIVVPS